MLLSACWDAMISAFATMTRYAKQDVSKTVGPTSARSRLPVRRAGDRRVGRFGLRYRDERSYGGELSPEKTVSSYEVVRQRPTRTGTGGSG